MYSKVIQLYLYILLKIFFSIMIYFRIPNRIPCAVYSRKSCFPF